MLKDDLMNDLKDAMKDKDEIKKNTVQMVRAAILQIEKDNGIKVEVDIRASREYLAKSFEKFNKIQDTKTMMCYKYKDISYQKTDAWEALRDLEKKEIASIINGLVTLRIDPLEMVTILELLKESEKKGIRMFMLLRIKSGLRESVDGCSGSFFVL